ncbi:MAG: hypothetical protein AAF809_05195 [Bacteroidota bacterium]
MSLALAIVGTLSLAVGCLYMLVRAFEASPLWGIGCLLFGPLLFVFTFLYWDEAKAGFLASAAGLAVLFVGGSL